MSDVADDWAPVKQAGADDDWAPVAKAAPVAEPPPPAFLDRLKAGGYLTGDIGAAMPEAHANFFRDTFEGRQIKGAWDMFTLPGRVASGQTRLDTSEGMDEAVGLGVGIALGRMNEAVGNGHGAPVIEQPNGRLARPYVDGAGKPQVAPIGDMPRPQDFENAGKTLAPETPRLPDPAFKDWFAGSKASDESGNPIEVFHGTSLKPTQTDFAFDKSRLGEATGAPSAKEAFFFTEDAGVAKSYADSSSAYEDFAPLRLINRATAGYYERANEALLSALGTSAKREGRLVSANLAAKNPLVVDLKGSEFREESFADTIKRAKADGHDSVKFENAIDEGFVEGVGAHPSNIWAVFEPDQIKVKKLSPADIVQNNLKEMWQQDGIHPAEAVHDAQTDGFLKNEITSPREEVKLDPETEQVLTDTGGKPGSLSAAITPPDEIPLDVQPASPPGSLAASFKAAGDKLMDMGRDAQMLLAPMARGTTDSMAIAKDFANSMRRNRWDWARIDKDIADRFTPEQRARMWNAADEESLSLRLEEPASMREHQGLNTLEPAERAAVEELQTRSQNAWVRARDLGMVEGEGLPAYTPRMIINVASAGARDTALALDGIGGNLRTKTGNLLKRKYMEAEDTQAAAQAKYGDQAMLARDIRVLPLATSQLEDAIAGRTLINSIKEYGERTGAEMVSEGSIPIGTESKWFTLDHPSFKTWKPKIGETADGSMGALKDEAGNAIFEQVPLYVHGDFEGPLRAVLSGKSGAMYGGMMALKGKTMSLIMNSPMIHNAVEWGRAFPAAPFKVGTFKVYFEGNAVKNGYQFSGTPRYVMDWASGNRVKIDSGSSMMAEAIDNGLVPIGHRFFNQDITSVMESPDLTPGRSLTSKILAAVPGLFDEGAGNAVKAAVDKAGDFWHNTLLWDRVADLQMGLYKNFLDAGIEKGLDRQTSAKVAAHLANRYAGSLPKEAMSDAATKIANIALFSRSFTLGNLGVMKDMLTGLPKDVMAQIERDADLGKRAERVTDAAVKFNDKIYTGNNHLEALEKAAVEHGTDVENIHTKADDSKQSQFDSWVTSSGRFIDSKEAAKVVGSDHPKLDSADPDFELQRQGEIQSPVEFAKSMARRKAISTVALDVGLLYVGNSVMQSALNVMLGGNTLDQEAHGYVRRFKDYLDKGSQNPLSMLWPSNVTRLSSTSENEPGLSDRLRVGATKDGTSIYARNPVGKIGEEFVGWGTSPIDILKRKEGTIARPVLQILSNDAGFGRKIYDPEANTPAAMAGTVWAIAKHLAGSQLPEGQITALSDLVKGEGDKTVNELQLAGPLAGVTFRKGAPGGPAVGEMYHNKSAFEFRVQQAMPDIRKQILRGDVAGAQQAMTGLGMDAAYSRWVVKTTQNPATRLGSKALRDFYRTATPEGRDRMTRIQGAPTAP